MGKTFADFPKDFCKICQDYIFGSGYQFTNIYIYIYIYILNKKNTFSTLTNILVVSHNLLECV